MEIHEPCQVGDEAALSGTFHVTRVSGVKIIYIRDEDRSKKALCFFAAVFHTE